MKILTAVVLLLVAGLSASTHAAGVAKEIHFAKGRAAATVAGAVIRGERDLYRLSAKKGQSLEVSISAVEDNAVFAIYKPGATVEVKDGFTDVSGAALAKASETDDAKSWKGHLPASGKYLIVVGGTRGNAEYQLKVTIH